MTEFMKTYKLKITVLSPVHIGASSDLEPTEYVIYSEKEKTATSQKQESSGVICPECGYKNPSNARYCQRCDCDLPIQAVSVKRENVKSSDSYLYTFTPGQLSAALSDADKNVLLKEAKKGELMALQGFFKDKAPAIVKQARKRALVAPEVAGQYEKKFGQINSKNNEFNRFSIEKQISDPVTGLPYIPGSSIKGAIRTALISLKNKQKHSGNDSYQKGTDVEKKLYGYENPTEDPFKALKLCDALAENDFITNVCTADNVKRRVNKLIQNKGVSTFMEVIPIGIGFRSSLSLSLNKNPHFTETTMEEIKKACNLFYTEILSEQEEYQISVHDIPTKLFDDIKCACNKRNAFLLCLGKHGGAESKTIDGLRKIRIMQGKGKPPRFENHATTYWFAHNGKERQPFGWCVVEFEEVK